MIYVTKKCGKCNYKIVSRRSGYMPSIGNPFIKCPKCGEWQLDGEYKEYAMWKPIDYFKYFAYRVLGDVGLASISFFIVLLIGQKLNLGERVINYLCISIPFIIFIFLLKSTHSTFCKEKEESNKRLMEDKKYLDLLYANHLISEDKYKEFKNIGR